MLRDTVAWTIVAGMICLTITVTVTSANLTRQPKTPAVLFYEACAWNAEPLQKKECAELASKEMGK